jgi:hypothetical protein
VPPVEVAGELALHGHAENQFLGELLGHLSLEVPLLRQDAGTAAPKSAPRATGPESGEVQCTGQARASGGGSLRTLGCRELEQNTQQVLLYISLPSCASES